MTQFRLAHSGSSVVLGQELGRGGEGIVFSLHTRDLAAKIYTKEPDNNKINKLRTMVRATSPDLLRIAAWPTDLLMDQQQRICGFVMPRIAARRDIHELYSPKSRAEAFPDTDFRFLVHVGSNIARAFAVIHAHGHVIGDVNHGNLLVGPDGTVILIDCDSFQVGQGPNAFPCDVGVPLFTAPELHGKGLRGIIRTANHDLFGLAVLLFHLLYMGRHPFAGRFLGHGDMPIEKAVAEYRFAYGPDRAANQMERPPGTIPLETSGDAVADLFIRAFERAGNYGGRPAAEKWIDALLHLETTLRVCPTAKWHHYPQFLTTCPWCTVERQTAVRLFGQRIVADRITGTIDVGALWKLIASVQGPGPDPALPSERPYRIWPGMITFHTAARTIRKTIAVVLSISGIAACNALQKEGGPLWAIVAYLVAYIVWPHVPAEKRAEAQRARHNAMTQWENTVERWKREASQRTFREKFEELERAKTQLCDLPKQRQQGLAKLEAERQQRQLQRYLDRFRIDRADIPGIGPSRKSMLASYGVETAADVVRRKIDQIPGFGRKLTGEVLSWRKRHEQNFRFNPNEPLDPRDIQALDRDLESQRADSLRTLRDGPEQLRRISSEVAAARTRLMPLIERAWNDLKISEATVHSL